MKNSRFFSTLSHYLFQYPFTAVIVLSLLILNRMGISSLNDRIVSFWGRTLFFSMATRIVIKGEEHLDRDSRKVVVLNHASLFDIPAVLTFLPDASFIGRQKLLTIPFFGRLLKALGYIPIDPAHLRQSMDALERASDHLTGGKSIIMFPEGTRTLDGELGRFKRGFVKILRKTDADLLPVTLNGFFDLKSKYSRSVNSAGALELIVHKPLKAEVLRNMNDREIIEITQETIGSVYKGRRNENE